MMDTRPAKRPRKAESAHDTDDRASSNLSDDHTQPGGIKKPKSKPPLSCAECRRLKLKCDRVFPCKSCTKRGCAEICPDGSLTSGKGSRFILANTEQLHAKIIQMSDRIRHLEDALEMLQRASSSHPHPLLLGDLLSIKHTLELYGPTAVHVSNSTAQSSDDGQHHHYSDAQYSPYPERGSPSNGTVTHLRASPRQSSPEEVSTLPDLPADLLHLSKGFPIPLTVGHNLNHNTRQRLRDQLPSRARAEYLFEQARQNALWQYNPHPEETFFPNLLHQIYSCPLRNMSFRRLGLLFMILALGSLVDLKQASDSPDGEKYHHLARAALSESSIMEDTSIDTIVTLFYMMWYLLVFNDNKKGIGHAWGLMGITAKLAHSIGLHRDGCSGSKVIPEEVEKRRMLFYELLHFDTRLALSLGRPASLYLRHADCKLPSYVPDSISHNTSESLHHCQFQEWKHASYVHYLSPVLELISSPATDYATIIDVDKRVRDSYIPSILQSSAGPHSRYKTFQQASVSFSLEAVFLQLHRTYFTRALNGPEALNRRNKYAPSVVAVFRSASLTISNLEALYHQEPELSVRFLYFWYNAFSAAVALCLLVSRAPFSCLAPPALQDLERARRLFTLAKEHSSKTLQVLPILETMVEKARNVYMQWITGGNRSSIVLRESDDERARNASGMNRPTQDAMDRAHIVLQHTCQTALDRAALNGELYSDALLPGDTSPGLWRTSCAAETQRRNFAYDLSPDGSSVIPLLATSTVSTSFRMPVVDTLNFDFGAIEPDWRDESWMVWF